MPTDIVVVSDAQQQALDQARQTLGQGENAGNHSALEAAIKEMERAQAALEAAKKSPDKLPAAIAAEQAAYQALLKATPREFRMRRSGNRGQGQANLPASRTSSSSTSLISRTNKTVTKPSGRRPAPHNAQQREQTQVADRLKELAQRQQDLNERMRELQTSLQAARTDQERTDIQNSSSAWTMSSGNARQRGRTAPAARAVAKRQRRNQCRSSNWIKPGRTCSEPPRNFKINPPLKRSPQARARNRTCRI